jgi:NACalpha-BTF3-like transcription factor
VERSREESAKREMRNERNKYFRRFTTIIKKKFRCEFVEEYKYVEVKVDNTPMVVDDAEVYIIDMPSDTKKYYLVVGDLQLKRDFLHKIDPTYGSESVLEEQHDFMNKMQKKSGVVENEHDIPELIDVVENEHDIPELIDVVENEHDIPELIDVLPEKDLCSGRVENIVPEKISNVDV